MKKIHLFLALVTFFFAAISTIQAQKEPVKFGKISDEEWQLAVYEKDTAATAVVLCDYGVSDFIYSESQGFQIQFDRIQRIKILKKEGYQWANGSFLISKKYDKVGKLKGVTYNQEDRKVVKTKLDNDQIFKEDYNKYFDVMKFEMPAVKEGSIIEIEYSITSESWDIDDWQFQTGIPTLHSEYRVSIPEYFYYKQLEKGFFPIGNKLTNMRTTKQTGTVSNRTDGRVTQTNFQNYAFDYQVTDYTFISKDIPAFYTEEYITSRDNYISEIQFELGNVKWPNQPIKNYTTTWEAIAKLLLEDSDFGSRIDGGWAIKDEMAVVKALNTTPEAKVNAVFELVRGKMNWDGRNSIYSLDQGKAWKEGSGSSGDINLLLVAAFRRLNMEAYPVILSTRSNGFVHPAQIIIDQFNYVIAAVRLNDKYILLDGTDKNSPMGILPERCLNGQGRLISEKGGEWVDLKPLVANKKSYQFKMEINAGGNLTGTIIEKSEGYAAIEQRSGLKYHTDDTAYLKEYQKSHSHFEMTFDSISGKSELSNPILLSYQFESEDWIEKAGNLWMVSPLLLGQRSDNPFKLEKRDYPVDYSFPHSTTHMVTFAIPDGFVVENLPETKKMILPERTASFMYLVQQTGNTIVVVSKFDINKVTFLPEEYADLKEFYNHVIAAQAKQIILKKL
ncbi:MAG: DUF3857 domain-containing protein [Salinivirgaceae bacterium]|nr:DUF3857 domain-containing protein [Salinivirgaceae bacterium]